jgi:hypothetical protein
MHRNFWCALFLKDDKTLFFLFFPLTFQYLIVGGAQAKIIKQRYFICEWGRGEGDFFFGLAMYRANILHRKVIVYNSKHLKQQEAFWRD